MTMAPGIRFTLGCFLFTVLCMPWSSCQKDPQIIGPYTPGTKDTIFTNYFRTKTGFVAGDGAFSIPMGNGKSFLVFGDSYIDSYDPVTQTVPCIFNVHNCGVTWDIQNPVNQKTYSGIGSPGPLFSYGTSNNFWFWPGAGFANNDTIYVMLERITSSGSSFARVDTNYVACMPIANPGIVSYFIRPSRNGIDFSKSVIKDTASGFCYVYGTKKNGIGNDVFVARFPINAVKNDWQYYSSHGWTNNAMNAQSIYNDFTASFYVCRVKQKYIMISTEFSFGCDQGKNIYITTSDNPFGPFENKHSIWQVDDLLDGHYPFFYLANAHPEFDNGKNELLITYCINGYGTCVNTCINGRMNPDVYRPKAIRVAYHLLDPGL